MTSHPVTVTERDTVPRASRHIRPSLEGGVHVTRDQKGKGIGGIDLVIGHRVLRTGTRQLSTGLQFSAGGRDGEIKYQRRAKQQLETRLQRSTIPRASIPHIRSNRPDHLNTETAILIRWLAQAAHRCCSVLQHHRVTVDGTSARALSAILTLSERKARARVRSTAKRLNSRNVQGCRPS
jgi:hypothetical protein